MLFVGVKTNASLDSLIVSKVFLVVHWPLTLELSGQGAELSLEKSPAEPGGGFAVWLSLSLSLTAPPEPEAAKLILPTLGPDMSEGLGTKRWKTCLEGCTNHWLMVIVSG